MQYRPWQRFCSARCRRQFHKNGGAFGSLKDKFPKWIADEVRKQLAALVDERVIETMLRAILAEQGKPTR